MAEFHVLTLLQQSCLVNGAMTQSPFISPRCMGGGLQYLVCLSVCVCVCVLPQKANSSRT